MSPGEVLLQVAVHFPHAPEQVSEEWVVLGSQRLCVLRDALFCVVDTNVKNMEREVRGLVYALCIMLSGTLWRQYDSGSEA